MKKAFSTILSLTTLLLTSVNVTAHPGHLESQYVSDVHSFLHIEHLVAILATLAVVCGIALIRGK